MIWLTSDTHFGHDREFIWKVRGFNSCEEMNEAIIERWNERVGEHDYVYHLGDVFLGSIDNINYLQRLKGKIFIVLGNHDTDNRISHLGNVDGVLDYKFALREKINGYHFYMSHDPTITSNLQKESLKQCTLNLYGHTHQKNNFYLDYPFMYHVGVDSHDCAPVSIEQIISDMKEQVEKCKSFL